MAFEVMLRFFRLGRLVKTSEVSFTISSRSSRRSVRADSPEKNLFETDLIRLSWSCKFCRLPRDEKVLSATDDIWLLYRVREAR